MKTKKIVKKLSLSKKTVSNLETEDMYNVLGGLVTDYSKCITDCYICPTIKTICSTCCP